MGITIASKPAAPLTDAKPVAINCNAASTSDQDKTTYKVPAKSVSDEYLRGPGSLRVQHLMYLYARSKSAINRNIAKGHIPAPTGHDPKPFWSNEVIRQHLAGKKSGSKK